MTRTKQVDSEREKERAVDDFVTRGYKIEQQSQYVTKVKEKDWGDPIAHGFVFLFTLLAAALLFDAADAPAAGVWVVAILVNVAYAVYSRVTAEEVIIKVRTDAIE